MKAVALHSRLPQERRLKSLELFRAQVARVLVATDVASRGLDIPTVDLVINYNVPREVEDYVHRVGRTARAGRGGRSVTLVTQYDIERVHKIEEGIDKQLTEYTPDEELVLRHINETVSARALASTVQRIFQRTHDSI